MAKVRRRVLRPPPLPEFEAPARVVEKQQQLAKERATLKRWMTKLKRAFHAMEKQQTRIARLERQLKQLQRE